MSEVEVIYLNGRGYYTKRKFKRYQGLTNALIVYRQTVNKLRSEGTFALITLRKYQLGFWVLEKTERV